MNDVIQQLEVARECLEDFNTLGKKNSQIFRNWKG